MLTSRQRINGHSESSPGKERWEIRPLGSHVQLLTLVFREERDRTPRKSRIFTKVQVYLTCVGYLYEAVSVINSNSVWECYVNSLWQSFTATNKNRNSSLDAN